MGLEKDDIDFDRRVAKKRHTQLIDTLNAVASEIEKKPKDDGLKEKFDKHIEAINKLTESMKAIPKPDAPIVNVQTNNKEIVESFKQIADGIIAELQSLKECYAAKQPDCSFEFDRDRNGYIASPIIIKAK